jgi:hypothetical protein
MRYLGLPHPRTPPQSRRAQPRELPPPTPPGSFLSWLVQSGPPKYTTRSETPVLAGQRPSDVLRALQAGTLEGVSERVPISDSTFFKAWRRAEEELRRKTRTYEGPTILDLIAVEMVRRDRGITDTEGLAEALGWERAKVETVLDLEAQAQEHGSTVSDLIEKRRREAEQTPTPGV